MDIENNTNDYNEKQSPIFDALDAGIEYGGLRSKSDIAIIVCYLIANSSIKLTEQNIVDTVVSGKIANYFEICDAISKQLAKGNIIKNNDGTLSINEDSKKAIKIVENDLPLTIREKSIELSRRIASNEILKKENKVEITEKDGKYIITMHVSDKESDFMTLTLNVATAVQAQTIKEKFQKYPLNIYENLISSIFSHNDNNKY